ncbi:MAG TPA: aminotransferase class I/II-fold pyridoxal phosphate-dependent enzyme [Jatrophihabitans sp.]|nr:aminotransferase class I/II-fold pyridoxal phosphate-dependent enzyme [Jatrophihabitans sp.]
MTGGIRDLTWTGNQFLDPRLQLAEFTAAVSAVDLSTKGDTWSTNVAAELARYHGLPAARIRVGAGATQLIETVLRTAYSGLIVDVIPNFHLTSSLAAQEGWTYVPVPVREPAELLGRLEPYLGRPDAVITLSSPRNPLGYQFEPADIAVLLERCRGTVLLDEVYADFAPASALELVERYPNLVVVRTFSKAWGLANLRIGYAVGQCFADPAFRFRLLPNSVSGVAQQAALAVLADPARVLLSIEQARQAREALRAALAAIDGLHVWPSAANYLCLETPQARQLEQELAGRGLLVRVLQDLRIYPADWPDGLRIVVPADEQDADTVVRSIARMHAPAPVGRP